MGAFQDKFFAILDKKAKQLKVDADVEFFQLNNGHVYFREGLDTLGQIYFRFDTCEAEIRFAKQVGNGSLDYYISYSDPKDTVEKFFEDLTEVIKIRKTKKRSTK